MEYKYVIIGAGNGGQSLAGDMVLRGTKVSAIYDKNPAPIRDIQAAGGIKMSGPVVQGFAPIEHPTESLEDAMQQGNVFLVTIVGNFHPVLAREMAPFVRETDIILLIPGMQFFSGYLTSAVSLLFPNWLSQYEKLMETAGLDSDIGLFMFIYAVILGPVCEELVFRGVTMRLVRRALPFWAANLMQAVLFGIFHMNWIQGIYAFVLGLVLGWICEKGGSIYFSMFFHILFNFWGTIIGPLLNNLKETDLLGIIIFLFTIVSLVLGFSLFRLGTKWRDQKAARLMAAPDHDDHFEAAE